MNHQTPSGDTALHIVCRGLLNFQDKNLITVKNLLKFGADINILNKKVIQFNADGGYQRKVLVSADVITF